MAQTLVFHLFCCWTMCGLIWFVQVVHYPLFHRVHTANFAAYETAHTKRTSLVVIPLMLPECITAIVLCLQRNEAWFVVNLVLLALIWLSTFTLQVPCHRRLSRGYDVALTKRLVATNWVRTLLWSVRSIGWLVWLIATLSTGLH